MSNNELYCSKCKSNHHPAEDCVKGVMADKALEGILDQYITNCMTENLLIITFRNQAKAEIKELFKKKFTEVGRDAITFWQLVDQFNEFIEKL